MFNWNVEELKLRKSAIRNRFGTEFPFMSEVSREDKIEFIDRMNEGQMSELLRVHQKYQEEKSTLHLDDMGYPKTVSLIAWLKKNDPMELFDRSKYSIGKLRFFTDYRSIFNLNRKGSYDRYEDIVDEIFYRVLSRCLHKEDIYFEQHDPLEIAKTKVHDYSYKYGTTFGNPMSFCSDGTVRIQYAGITDDEQWPRINLAQCEKLIEMYQNLEEIIQQMSKLAPEAIRDLA